MRRTWKTALVWATAALTTANPASAGRFWRCCPPPCCYVQCTPCQPVECCDGSSPASPSPAPTGTYRPVEPVRPETPAPELLEPAPGPVPPTTEPPLVEPPTPRETPVPEPPTPDMPEETPEAPATPAEDMPETPAEPKTPDKPAADVEDLFKDADADKKPADVAPEPAEKPAEEPAKPADKADDVEDLFKETDEKKSAATAAAAPLDPIAAARTREIENLFSEPTDAASPMRLWTDNTGKYQVRARLVVVGNNYVRLLKDTGRYTTVRFHRLSGGDLAFVRYQVSSALAGNF